MIKGTSKAVREKIISEVQSSDFLSIQADETMDSTQTQLVLGYINDGNQMSLQVVGPTPSNSQCLMSNVMNLFLNLFCSKPLVASRVSESILL